VRRPVPVAVAARPHGLPDRRCTPGAAYPKVTQRNIGRTICRSGWTSTVRPPGSYTEKLERQPIAEYGYRDKKLADYEEDHLIPLEIGGSPRPVNNLWPEYDAGKIPNPKDEVEDALHRAVCDGKDKLAPGAAGDRAGLEDRREGAWPRRGAQASPAGQAGLLGLGEQQPSGRLHHGQRLCAHRRQGRRDDRGALQADQPQEIRDGEQPGQGHDRLRHQRRHQGLPGGGERHGRAVLEDGELLDVVHPA